MKLNRVTLSTISLCLILLFTAPLPAHAQGPPPMPAEELPPGSQVLTSGPVHEAFAEPVTLDAQAGVLVPRQPPAAIAEVPPAERPAAANVVWVPGYWAWDPVRADFIWVSGCWRIAPPGMYWVPGYWTAVAGGWEWVAGFWAPASADEEEIRYLPAPPAAIDLTPPGPAPTLDVVWVPGCWYWLDGRYVVRRGYWLTAREGWLWVPSHYAWTPRGYVFCPGYWDRDVDDRGVLFAPVWFPAGAGLRLGFAFSPSVYVDLGLLRISLFASPRTCHYYFGDYYDPVYPTLGIYPRFDCDRLRTWYDPVFVYDRWRFGRHEPNWVDRERRDFDARRANPALRPPRTFSEMQARLAVTPAPQRAGLRMAQPVKTSVTRGDTLRRFETMDATERQRIATQSEAVRRFRSDRARWESERPATPVLPPALERRPAAETRPRDAATPRMTTPRVEQAPPAVRTRPAEQRPRIEQTRPSEHTGPFVAPHDVRARQPERVKLPEPPPIISRPAAPEVKSPPERRGDGKAPPAPSVEERGRDRGERDRDKGDGRDRGGRHH